jgi:hypothetical protein
MVMLSGLYGMVVGERMVSWSGWYHDRQGSEPIVIDNDGRLLRVSIRSVAFVGADFDALEPVDGVTDVPDSLRMDFGALCSCTIEWDIPVAIVTSGVQADGVLHCELRLGDPGGPHGGLDAEDLNMTLHGAGPVCTTQQSHGFFEEALDDLHRQLPANTYLKICITCAWSDYSPAGTPLFGGMACFRNAKEAYSRARSKRDIFAVWDQRTGFVQETFLCPEFERRAPNAGYRGSFPSTTGVQN